MLHRPRSRRAAQRGLLVALAVGAVALAAAAVVPGLGRWASVADAQETITLRIATLAPRGSAWMRIYNAWNGSLRQDTGGRLQLRFYPGGVSGDESDTINKVRAGQLDGAAVTGTGLGLVVRPVLLLQVPGVVTDYATLDRVRSQMASEWESQFEDNGWKLLGWGDVGEGRFFSKEPVRKPSDLRSMRPWAWRDDPVFNAFYQAARVNPVRLGVPEVYPALQTGMVNAAPGSALAVLNLQWFTKLSYMTAESRSVLIGATVLKKDKYDALPQDLRAVLDSTAERAHRALQTRIRRDDAQAFQTLQQRGLQTVDTSAHTAEWERMAEQTQNALAGRVYPRALLQRVKRIAAGG